MTIHRIIFITPTHTEHYYLNITILASAITSLVIMITLDILLAITIINIHCYSNTQAITIINTIPTNPVTDAFFTFTVAITLATNAI